MLTEIQDMTRYPTSQVKILFTAIISLISFSLSGQRAEEFAKRATEFMDPFVQNREFDGYVLVQKDGGLLVSSSFSSGEKTFNADTPFMIGSITKTLTAELISNLIKEGQLSLNTQLSDFLPNSPKADQIKIRHLLTHRSGIPDYYSIEQFKEVRNTQMPLAQFGEWVSKFPLDFDPGKGNSYSNSGYNILALTIEKITGVPYGVNLKDKVFSPLNMAASGSSGINLPASIPAGFEPDHAPDFVKAPNPIHPTWLTGSGSVYASANDLLKWANEVKNRLNSESKWLPYGWGIRKRKKEQYVEQNGRIPGFASSIRVLPESDLVIILLSRIESDAVNAIASGLTELSLDGKVETPKTKVFQTIEKEALKSFEGVFQIAPNFFVTTALVENGLGIATGRGEGLSFAALDALEDGSFFFRVGYSAVSFEKNKSGKVTGLFWGTSGPFPKVN